MSRKNVLEILDWVLSSFQIFNCKKNEISLAQTPVHIHVDEGKWEDCMTLWDVVIGSFEPSDVGDLDLLHQLVFLND